MEGYTQVKVLHSGLPAYAPLVPTSALPTIAFVSLCAAFALTFTLTTLHKSSIPVVELVTALVAAALAGGGVVALFCTVGVYV
ncbi:uncharacterized protein EHS24_001441 [Apiotrichum porosum]|uniref:Dolichyl-diphosphooligosaccharide-protein glycosyltransferase subunit OST5 n=1 Tax=Apiotrichum porosum TaxID=105984 RepID=A0A427XKH9_9TREE|nr:uncharacterized protein EHS24_001441 [Apiotrichum porosum]RSH79395.1 hypothetical protein EHS24_001441 [Apiotrichum porosum]